MNTFLLEVLFAQESTGFTYDYYLNNHMNQIGMRNFMLCMFLVIAAVILVVYAVSRLISANDARRNADALNVLKSNEVAVKDKEVAIKASSQELDAFMAFQKNPEMYASFMEFKACNGDPEKLAALAAKTSANPQSNVQKHTQRNNEELFDENDGTADLLAQAAELDDQVYQNRYTDVDAEAMRSQQELFDQQVMNDMNNINNDLF